MSTSSIDSGLPLAVVELLARVTSIASMTLLVLLFMGEALHPAEISSNERVGLLFFPIGVIIGMIVAWWKEGLGSVVTLLSLLAFYLVYGYLLRNHIGGWAFIAFASPGFLFLLHWLCATLVKSTPKSTTLSNRNLERLAERQPLGRGWHSSYNK
jgi:hypothetical protein